MAVAAPHATRSGQVAGGSPGAAAPAPRAARALLAALVACLLLAAFSSGASRLPEESWVQALLLVAGAGASAAWLFGGGIAFGASRAAWVGAGLLAAFAVLCGASIAWSVAPDRSWLELNRALAYALAAVLAIGAGSSLPRPGPRACAGIAVAGGIVALYAVGGKTLPGLSVAGLDLDHAGELSRLRSPVGYWNALGLLCGVTALACLGVAVDPERRGTGRMLALSGLAVALLGLGLTYSRGALLAFVAGLAVLLALGGARVRVLAWLGAGLLAAAAPLVAAFVREDLTTDGLPLGDRQDDALLVLVALAGGLALGILVAEGLRRLERQGAFTAAADRIAGRVLVALLLIAVVAAGGAAAASERGLGGTVADVRERFTTVQADATTDPQRLLSTSSGNRWSWWKEAAGAWSDRPVGGWGAGSFPVTHELYRQELLDVRQPHSMPLQWLAETGVAGALLAGGGLLALLAAALARVRASRPGPGRTARAALAGIGVAWCAQALVDWTWDLPAATLPALVALGVAASRPARARPRAAAARGLGLAGVVLVLVVAGVSAALPAVSAALTQRALSGAAAEGAPRDRLAQAASRAELATRLNPLAIEPLFAAASIAERLEQPDLARRRILRAIERQPWSADAWARLCRLALTRGDFRGLSRAAGRLLRLDPKGVAARDFARRAQLALTPPEASPTATGSPLPQPAPPAPPAPATAEEAEEPAAPDEPDEPDEPEEATPEEPAEPAAP